MQYQVDEITISVDVLRLLYQVTIITAKVYRYQM